MLEAGRGKPSDNGNRKDYNFVVDWSADCGIAAEPGKGRVVIDERQRGSPLDTLVAELMIMANATWGAMLRDAGIPAIHFVGPSIWAWRGGRIKRIARSVSHMLCLFPFEPELYERAGVPVSYVGHPLADEFPLEPDRAAARERLGIPLERGVVAMLPGSRQSEVRNLADIFIGTAKTLHERDPERLFLVPLATRETRQIFEEALHRNDAGGLPIRMLFGHAVEAMTAADVVLVASGTASLEAALLKRPMVITYRIGKWQYRLMKRMAYLPWVGLPNILCGETVVPELLQDEADPEHLAAAIDDWFADDARRAAVAARFSDLHRTLRQDTARRAAEAILPYLDKAGKAS